MSYICHSGGAEGSDIEWENQGSYYGVKTVAYSFGNHVQKSKNQKILSFEELKEGLDHVVIANNTLKRRPLEIMYPYVKNLLARNWFQVKNSESIFAISKKFRNNKTIVDGGTGWAVQMAIDNNKPVFVFDQVNKQWTKFNYETKTFDVIDYFPKLTEHFAGIGTREITEDGIKAIESVYENNFSRSGVEEEQQTRFPVTEKIAGAAPVNTAILKGNIVIPNGKQMVEWVPWDEI